MTDSYSDDNHPFVIKMPDEDPVSEFGLGYEIFQAMKKFSGNVAQYVHETNEVQTYAELLDDCIRVAINIKPHNLSEDDILALCCKNHEKSSVPYLAGLFLNNKVAAIDPIVPAEEKAIIFQHVTPKLIFVDEEYLENIEETLRIAKLNIDLVVIGENTNGHRSYSEYLIASDDNVRKFQPVKLSSNEGCAMVYFSSGTSGIPKGICLSHRALLTTTDGPTAEISLLFAQLNWISYANLNLKSVRTGMARVFMKEFNMDEIWRVIEKYKVNLMFGSIYQIADLANSTKPEDVDISSLKVVVTGGTALPAEVFLKLNEKYPDMIVIEGYGLTELTGSVLFYDVWDPKYREMQLQKPNSCGMPLKGMWYKVVDPDTEEILGPNQKGELRIKSKLSMIGYHNMESSTCFDSNGWVKTGDIFEYDEEHCFYFIDRLKDVIQYRSWEVSPSKLEAVLMSHPDVDKAAVIGVPHAEDGQYPMGIVTLKENASVDGVTLEKYVEERVPDRRRLRGGVVILKEMPLTNTGKIQRRALKKQFVNTY